jgi:hypothetical protein
MTWGIRTRLLLDRNRRVAIATCLLLAVAGGWAAYGAHATTTTVEETRTDVQWELAVDWEHGATVANAANSTAFENGDRVANRDVYFKRVMPVLEGTTVLAYESDADEPLHVSVTRRLRVQNREPSSRDRRDPTVYWERTQDLGATNATIQAGTATEATFSVNVTRVLRAASRENERLGAPGRNYVRVLVTVTASRGDGEARTRNFTLPITERADMYEVQANDGQLTENETVHATVPVSPGPVRGVGGPLAVLLGVLGVGGLTWGRDAIAVSEDERDALAYRDDRERYADWITAGTLPDTALDRPCVDVGSLADLVDVAIDTEERVLYDTTRETYHVVHGDHRFEFDPPTLATTDGSETQALEAIGTIDVDPDETAPEDLPFGDPDRQDPDDVLGDDAIATVLDGDD